MKLLLVDDDKRSLDRLIRCTEELCPTDDIEAFTNSEYALKYAKTYKPDIAVLDIEMPGMDGLELAKHLKEIKSNTRIVFCTNYPEYALKAFQIHARGYILKPVTVEDLAKEIATDMRMGGVSKKNRIEIKTFGNFNIFADGQLVQFEKREPKEILAILVDYNGSVVRTEQIASILWEDGVYNLARQKDLYSLIAELKDILKEVDAEDILIKSVKGYSIDRNKVDCDVFKLKDGDANMRNQYDGRYMFEYSWAEVNVEDIL